MDGACYLVWLIGFFSTVKESPAVGYSLNGSNSIGPMLDPLQNRARRTATAETVIANRKAYHTDVAPSRETMPGLCVQMVEAPLVMLPCTSHWRARSQSTDGE